MNKVIFFVLLVAATLASSCGGASSASQNTTVRDKKLSVPANVRNPEPGNDIYRESVLLLSLPFGGSSEMIYQNKPLDRAQFDDLLKQYVETHAPQDYCAYLKSDSRTEYGRAIDVFKRLREKQIVDVRLVISPATETDSPKTEGFAAHRKEEVLSVEIPAGNAPSRIIVEPDVSDLTLEIDGDQRLRLDGKNLTSDELLAELARIFAYRTKVYRMREGTNEIDQSVRLKAPRSMSFGEVVEIIDLLRDARALPIYMQIEN